MLERLIKMLKHGFIIYSLLFLNTHRIGMNNCPGSWLVTIAEFKLTISFLLTCC
jgi:hypothetical protein